MMKLVVEIESVPLGINKPRQNTFTTACIHKCYTNFIDRYSSLNVIGLNWW